MTRRTRAHTAHPKRPQHVDPRQEPRHDGRPDAAHDDDDPRDDARFTREDAPLRTAVLSVLHGAPGQPFSVKQVLGDMRASSSRRDDGSGPEAPRPDARAVKRVMRGLVRERAVLLAPGRRYAVAPPPPEGNPNAPARGLMRGGPRRAAFPAPPPPSHAEAPRLRPDQLSTPIRASASRRARPERPERDIRPVRPELGVRPARDARPARSPRPTREPRATRDPRTAREPRPPRDARPGRPGFDALRPRDSGRPDRPRRRDDSRTPPPAPRASAPYAARTPLADYTPAPLPRTVTGVLRRSRNTWFLVPDVAVPRGAPEPEPLGVSEPVPHDVAAGDVVRIETESGRVLERLGEPGEIQVEVARAIARNGFEVEFPARALAEADAAPDSPPAAEIARRRDLRGLRTATIDPKRARDHDDAISIEPLPNGGARLYVHIADVSWYVRTGSPLDDAALSRATSVYFPDRVVPMLPERLSAHLCSLVAGVDRLAMTAILDYDADGGLKRTQFVESVVRPLAVLTYEQAWALISGKPDHGVPEVLQDDIRALHALTRTLRARRRERGSLDFDLPEPQFELDLQGEPTDIVRSERNPAHELIEECMLAANQAVAVRLSRARIPAIYRVHAPPDPRKVAQFAEAARGFGIAADPARLADPLALAAVTERLPPGPARRFLDGLLLRCMSRAVYQTENIGHFGLAFEHYVHFTSPIRRYPDLVTHRMLRRLVSKDSGTAEAGTPAPDEGSLAQVAEHSSTRERAAVDAERAVVDLLCARFMADKVGRQFDGIVSSVVDFGFFVRLDAVFVEGLVHVSRLGGDFFELDPRTHQLMGRRTRRAFRVGDAVRVEVHQVDVVKRFIDFAFVKKLRDGDKGQPGEVGGAETPEASETPAASHEASER